MSKLDMNIPLIITVTIKSDYVDFNVGGDIGWTDKVDITFLPPYPLSYQEAVTPVKLFIESIDIVPFDNMAIGEPAAGACKLIHKEAVRRLNEMLLAETTSFEFKKEFEGVVLYELELTVKEREFNDVIDDLDEEWLTRFECENKTISF